MPTLWASSESATRLFFRIVQSDPPTRLDFTSKQAQGAPSRDPRPEIVRLQDGLSVYSTEAQARRTARRYPVLGRYIAALRVPEGTAIRVERTLSREGHHTIWGEPDDLLARVLSVVPV